MVSRFHLEPVGISEELTAGTIDEPLPLESAQAEEWSLHPAAGWRSATLNLVLFGAGPGSIILWIQPLGIDGSDLVLRVPGVPPAFELNS